jgi:two-component system phosphate regulon response regulator OmpR
MSDSKTRIVVVDDDLRLRKLVESDQSAPHHIQTVWGFGYVFVPEPPSR